MFKYYAEKESDQHYLFSNEIAELLSRNYGITSENGTPATKLVEALLGDYEHMHGMPKLFYNTRHGLRRVYPFGIPLVQCASQIFDLSIGSHVLEIFGRKYKYRVKTP